MREIVLARIDDRLIHGQVMTAWLQFTGGNHIMIIDNETAGDEFTKSIMAMAVPNGIKLSVLTVEEAVGKLSGNLGNDKVILLAKEPQVYLTLFESGINIEEIIIGGMGVRKNRETLYKNIAASKEEKEIFRKILANGINMKIHVIPDQGAQAIETLL